MALSSPPDSRPGISDEATIVYCQGPPWECPEALNGPESFSGPGVLHRVRCGSMVMAPMQRRQAMPDSSIATTIYLAKGRPSG